VTIAPVWCDKRHFSGEAKTAVSTPKTTRSLLFPGQPAREKTGYLADLTTSLTAYASISQTMAGKMTNLEE
jgi:hypothetical protein